MPDTRDEIASAALAVAEYLKSGDYAAAIVSGGSHQLSHALLALGWKVKYPGTPMPKVFVLDAEANRMLYKREVDEAPDMEGFLAWMRAHVPNLEQLKREPLLFVDDYALQGEKYRELRNLLPHVYGFEQVDFAFFAAKEHTELGRDSFVGVRSDGAVAELYRLGQHVQGKEHADELLEGIEESAQKLRGYALDELRDIGRRMR
jgi:hypothetical protein